MTSHNKISKICGLENLNRLDWLAINNQECNPLRAIVEELGGLSSVGYALYPEKFVEYCKGNNLD